MMDIIFCGGFLVSWFLKVDLNLNLEALYFIFLSYLINFGFVFGDLFNRWYDWLFYLLLGF